MITGISALNWSDQIEIYQRQTLIINYKCLNIIIRTLASLSTKKIPLSSDLSIYKLWINCPVLELSQKPKITTAARCLTARKTPRIGFCTRSTRRLSTNSQSTWRRTSFLRPTLTTSNFHLLSQGADKLSRTASQQKMMLNGKRKAFKWTHSKMAKALSVITIRTFNSSNILNSSGSFFTCRRLK